ncbi:uncharacterized protein LOC123712450 isoform X1 [Pieris brassicae]|uniref:uncharacterized protein LOC123712450 isoform X1 n=2 Tax=Pieris brassicae TaxID=7116 RepID=UPI001E66226E|nr:uncharacterized protein LOC123712450 isoform X1 [Pieris brassicae]
MSQTIHHSCNTYYNANYNYTSITNKDNDDTKMHGSRRVVVFCLLTTVLPSILIISPLYLRHIKYADVMYKISDSDVIQIHKGQSSIFCERHSLKMNNTFNAFQMEGRPHLSKNRKHITLRKSMSLPDDTLEYWGFYLFAGATVELKACSRYEGSKILVVKGDKTLDTCGILEGNKYRKDTPLISKNENVSVTLQSPDIDNLLELKEDLNSQRETVTDNYEIANTEKTSEAERIKRDTLSPSLHNPNTLLDTGVNHGGNANPKLKLQDDASVSSFENNLHECYNENMIINEYFPYSIQCNNTRYLEVTTTLKVVHDVTIDGYYYYIFYSDNDFVVNDVHAIFDIYKPIFQYSNMSDTKVCINKTECYFGIDLFSDELVIVDVPTRDGLRNEDTSILISVCHPRMSVYIIFPVSVLLLVLLFAFL